MATQSLLQPSNGPQTTHYTIKEFQLLVKDAPVVPAEIQPFVGVSFRSSADIYRLFKGLAEMPVESFLVVHLDGKNPGILLPFASSISKGFIGRVLGLFCSVEKEE